MLKAINYTGHQMPKLILQGKRNFLYLYFNQEIDKEKLPGSWVAGFRVKKHLSASQLEYNVLYKVVGTGETFKIHISESILAYQISLSKQKIIKI